MRTISPKKKEKKKAKKINKAKQPEGRGLAELQGPRVSPPSTMSVKCFLLRRTLLGGKRGLPNGSSAVHPSL